MAEEFRSPNDIDPTPAGTGYLVVDLADCAGCESCMLACSLVNLGQENPALSRIQVGAGEGGLASNAIADSSSCLSCRKALCLEVCPVDALAPDESGAMRRAQHRCIDCGRCSAVCPAAGASARRRLHACDLCATAPYWSYQGGVEGRQACVEACPTGALRLQTVEAS